MATPEDNGKTQLARAWWQAVATNPRRTHAMAQPTNIEQLQMDIRMTIEAQRREAAVRALLAHLDPHDDDGQQPYPEILRRTQNALATEFHRVRQPESSDG